MATKSIGEYETPWHCGQLWQGDRKQDQASTVEGRQTGKKGRIRQGNEDYRAPSSSAPSKITSHSAALMKGGQHGPT
jgi:hypothetical protein